jgi:hypothetical protein
VGCQNAEEALMFCRTISHNGGAAFMVRQDFVQQPVYVVASTHVSVRP